MKPSPVDGLLSQPTRARLVAMLAQLRRTASTEELAGELGLHPNGVRRHLGRLEAAGLVERGSLRHGRGRPRDQWSLTAVGARVGEPKRRYGDVARWLARAAPRGRQGLRRIEETGRAIGRELAPREGLPPVLALRESLAALGFDPELEATADAEVCCTLGNCPYVESVKENPEAVCGMHRGITVGLLDVVAPGAELSRWEPHDPERAGCVAVVAGLRWEPGELAAPEGQAR